LELKPALKEIPSTKRYFVNGLHKNPQFEKLRVETETERVEEKQPKLGGTELRGQVLNTGSVERDWYKRTSKTNKLIKKGAVKGNAQGQRQKRVHSGVKTFRTEEVACR